MEPAQNIPPPESPVLPMEAETSRKARWYKKRLGSMSPAELKEFRRKQRVRNERHYQRHKPEMNEQARRQYADRQQFLSEEELQECIKDPTKAPTIRGDEWIACLLCRQLVQVIGQHLHHKHPDCPLRAYREKFGYNYKPGLASKAYAANKRATTKVNLGDLNAMRERARINFGPARAKRKGQRVSLVARLKHSKRMKGQKTRNQKGQKASTEKVLDVLALNLPLPAAAKLLGISYRALYSRAERLNFDTGANHRIQRQLITYCAALCKHLRESHSPMSTKDVFDWHAEQMRLGADDLFQKTAMFLPSIKSELQSDPACLEKLARQSSGQAAGTSGRLVIGLASRILKRVNARQKSQNSQNSLKVPRKTEEQRSQRKLAKAVRNVLPKWQEGLRVWRGAQKVYPTERKKWESAVRQVGFTAQADIDILMAKNTPRTAAAASIAHLKGLTTRTVQNACSANSDLFETASHVT